MIGTKHISDLITNPDVLQKGRINIIDAGVSAGKTFFALSVIPQWAGNPARCLYLIDTTNGEMRIQLNAITVARIDYAFFDYNTREVWGESGAAEKMPIMTYSGFGSELRKNMGKFHWLDYDYIICDEMQNLVGYQEFALNRDNLVAAEVAIRTIAVEKKATVVAISATPQKVREHFGGLCHKVPFDHTDLVRLRTFSEIPYSCPIEKLLDENKGKTGILYTTEIGDMKKYIRHANSIGMRANGFWSPSVDTQKKDPHT